MNILFYMAIEAPLACSLSQRATDFERDSGGRGAGGAGEWRIMDGGWQIDMCRLCWNLSLRPALVRIPDSLFLIGLLW